VTIQLNPYFPERATPSVAAPTRAQQVADLVRHLLTLPKADPDRERFMLLISAVREEDSVEGSIAADDYAAAMFLRTYALDSVQFQDLADVQLHRMKFLLLCALRTFRISRVARRTQH